jgi:hypothetical protein
VDDARAHYRTLAEGYAAAMDGALHHVTTQVLDGERGTTWCLAHHVTPDWTLETVGVRYADTLSGGRFARRDATALWVKVEQLPKTGLAFDQVVQEELA